MKSKPTPSNADKQLVKDAVRRLYEAREGFREMERHYKAVKEKESIIISNYIYAFMGNENSFNIRMDEGTHFYQNKKDLNVSNQRRTKVTWDVEKMQNVFPKHVYNMCVKKTYTINDIDGIVEYLKSCGVSPKVFKKYIDVSKKVDTEALEQAYQMGEIRKSDAEKCCSIEYGEPYIVLKEKQKNGEDI